MENIAKQLFSLQDHANKLELTQTWRKPTALCDLQLTRVASLSRLVLVKGKWNMVSLPETGAFLVLLFRLQFF